MLGEQRERKKESKDFGFSRAGVSKEWLRGHLWPLK